MFYRLAEPRIRRHPIVDDYCQVPSPTVTATVPVEESTSMAAAHPVEPVVPPSTRQLFHSAVDVILTALNPQPLVANPDRTKTTIEVIFSDLKSHRYVLHCEEPLSKLIKLVLADYEGDMNHRPRFRLINGQPITFHQRTSLVNCGFGRVVSLRVNFE